MTVDRFFIPRRF